MLSLIVCHIADCQTQDMDSGESVLHGWLENQRLLGNAHSTCGKFARVEASMLRSKPHVVGYQQSSGTLTLWLFWVVFCHTLAGLIWQLHGQRLLQGPRHTVVATLPRLSSSIE